ncbi:hypothetical protein [Pedobacter heparinus]|uniref:Uncharacterized protein n=1 Tax=Pedobacter heparinus (strain ATCC 13125 / DSM 2366 / CIP 104194 / JCM 7457 / NBRC 12017 / NCIMB 9290 / NRRL B-14731 / HIM 762-3) TaxID=485917 RepID=C6Y2C8_PEDHD|nr:hypothetical protein [Pedobacter heparinus]ACU03121.1 conserved hypothetical protein [Pedobacter heparinus DSM 2366]
MIDAIDFKQSIMNRQLPEGLALHLQALWYDGTGDWKTAHDLIDQLTDKAAAHVHAYLHRKEGDLWNADYWYNRAGQPSTQVSLEEEWENLVVLYSQ